ncbi:MAG: hypothetical protein ACM3QS_13460 [Bacteroidota bacterium]
MVHALGEIRRALVPGGIMLDLRPISGNWPVEVAARSGIAGCGRLADTEEGQQDDRAADGAIQEARRRGWFVLERQDEFPFWYYWDTPSEMKEFIETEWEDFEALDESVLRGVQAAWAVADADARVRVRLGMWIARWKKT